MIVSPLINHSPLARSVIPSLLCGVWLLACSGLKYPLQMLPLSFFELALQTIWLLAFRLPQCAAGQMPRRPSPLPSVIPHPAATL